MPELPEVETVRAGLERGVTGRTVAAVAVLHPRAVRRHAPGAAHFVAGLAGLTITGVRRRGKYLWLPLDGPGDPGDAILAHLGMSGQLLVRPPGAGDETHLRVRITFDDDGPELRFVDQRTFGGLSLSAGGAALPAEIEHIARDPMDPAFDDEAFVAAVRRRNTGIKRALLDQSLISGVGNIYADEALWRSRLHGARPTRTMTRPTVRRLLADVRGVLGDALHAGGTSFDSLYVDVNGNSGSGGRILNVYGRAGYPCKRCGTLIVRERFMNRSSHYCPFCQRKR